MIAIWSTQRVRSCWRRPRARDKTVVDSRKEDYASAEKRRKDEGKINTQVKGDKYEQERNEKQTTART